MSSAVAQGGQGKILESRANAIAARQRILMHESHGLDRAGQPLSLGSYAIDVDADGLGWIRLSAGVQAGVRFSAGIAADWGALPAAIRDGAAMLAAHLFDDRTGAQPIPAAVTALWRPFRVIQLGSERRIGVGA